MGNSLKMKRRRMVRFTLVMSTVYFGLHYTVYWVVSNGLDLPSAARHALLAFLMFAAASYLLGQWLAMAFRLYYLKRVGNVLMGTNSLAFVIFIPTFFIGSILGHPLRFTIAGLIVALLLVVGSSVNVAAPPRIKRLELALKNLPVDLSGFKLVQLSDIHLDGLKSEKWLRSMIAKVNSTKPDLIVITGDLVDAPFSHIAHLAPLFRSLKATYGVVAITGNHEYYVGFSHFMAFVDAAGIRPLTNQKADINGLQVIGVPDDTAASFGNEVPDLDRVLAECDINRPIILLDHKPSHFDHAAQKGIDLQLSGHTHAGQIPPWDLFVYFRHRYSWGLYQVGDAFLYTTCGTGTWGPPMRLFSRSEIVAITFKPSSAA